MKMRFKSAVLAVFFVCAQAFAQTAYQPYFVSGVLKQNGSDTTIKIVQGMVVSDSPANAQIVFTAMASKQFVGYTMVDVLASNFSQLYKTLPVTSEGKQESSASGTGV